MALGRGIGGSGYTCLLSRRPLPARKNKKQAQQANASAVRCSAPADVAAWKILRLQCAAANKDLRGANEICGPVNLPPLAANKDLRQGLWGKFRAVCDSANLAHAA